MGISTSFSNTNFTRMKKNKKSKINKHKRFKRDPPYTAYASINNSEEAPYIHSMVSGQYTAYIPFRILMLIPKSHVNEGHSKEKPNV